MPDRNGSLWRRTLLGKKLLLTQIVLIFLSTLFAIDDLFGDARREAFERWWRLMTELTRWSQRLAITGLASLLCTATALVVGAGAVWCWGKVVGLMGVGSNLFLVYLT